MIETFNHLLALILMVLIIPGIWVAQGLGTLSMPGEVIGATIIAWGLVLRFYFRDVK